MAPIRIGLVGLSASATTSWAEEGHLPYLLSAKGKAHYEITALLNSSVARANEAKTHFGLPASVATYGDPAALAADPAVDLVVVATRVDSHAALALPAALAGKALFVEWPLAHSTPAAAQLLAAATNPTLVGLQARVSPPILTLLSLLAANAIGPVLSSHLHAYGNLLPRDALPEGLAYFAARTVGGNPANIALGHILDAAHHVLGEYAAFQATAQIMRPELNIVNAQGEKTGMVTSDVPDLIVLAGGLAGKSAPHAVRPGATLSVVYRSGPPPPSTRGLVWTIAGETGEVTLRAKGPYLQSDSYGEAVDIEVLDFASGAVTTVDWAWRDWQAQLPVRARSVGLLYERYALGSEGGAWPGFREAVQRQRQIDAIYEKSGI